MMRYPVTLTLDDNDSVMVTFPDVPEAITYGDTIEEALARAPDALLTIFDAFIKDRRPIPPPSTEGSHFVTVPALVETKVFLYDTMRTAHIGKAELARRLHWHLPQVDRLLAMTHGSRLEQLEAAFGALGKQLSVRIQDAPPPVHQLRRTVQHFSTPRRPPHRPRQRRTKRLAKR